MENDPRSAVSLPSSPLIISLPPLLRIVSFPLKPIKLSSLFVPIIRSSPENTCLRNEFISRLFIKSNAVLASKEIFVNE